MTSLFKSRVRTCTFGKYKGQMVKLIRVLPGQVPPLYLCKVISNGMEIALFEGEFTEAMKGVRAMRLENWELMADPLHMDHSPYQAPELVMQVLRGNVYGHERFRDGDLVLTSPIVRFVDGQVITLAGSRYGLGEPHPNYEARYPEAKQRVLNAMQVVYGNGEGGSDDDSSQDPA